jgi:hypothetical protein
VHGLTMHNPAFTREEAESLLERNPLQVRNNLTPLLVVNLYL